jgi:rhodanese-related sulfurtransferase
MRKFNFILIVLIAGVFSFSACNNQAAQEEIVVGQTNLANESEALVNFLEKSGDYINSAESPSLIDANDVSENGKKYLVLDIRINEDYVAGHIDGAINTPANEVLQYLELTESAAAYEKVVIACYSGQNASYITSVLRMLGYGNVYALKFGMSSWNKATASHWLENISNKFVAQLEQNGNPKNAKSALPQLNTESANAYDVLYKQAFKVLDEGLNPAKIKAEEVFADPSKYYIINYWPLEQYAVGHIPGAVQYQPKKTLATSRDLTTLPSDKPIVVYCYTGQNAAFVTAFLRVLGYDAKVLLYGANFFMNGKMKSDPILGNAFSVEKINNFPLTEGEEPSKMVVKAGLASQKADEPKAGVPVKKKKEVSEAGGC